MRWQDMKSAEFRALGPDVAIVWPLASTEQHGEHLPTGTDTYVVTALAEGVERNLPDRVLLLPTLWLGASHHHRGFPGTVSLAERLYIDLLIETVSGVIEGDVCAPGNVRRILLLNGHGGNIYPGQTALSELASRHRDRTDLIVAFASYWEASADAISTVKMETRRLTHACEYETSLMLSVHGSLVDMTHAQARDVAWPNRRFTPDASRSGGVSVAAPFHARSANGALGSPELATVEKGSELVDAITRDLTEFIDEFLAWPELADMRGSEAGGSA